jgi:hypothetical protein
VPAAPQPAAPAARTAPRQRRASRTGTVLLLLSLPLIGAGAFATWRFRDRIFRGALGGAAPSATANSGPGGVAPSAR